MDIYEQIIKELINLHENEFTSEKLHNIKKIFSKKYNIKNLPTNIQLQKEYKKLVNEGKITESKKLQILLMKRKVRSLS